MYKNKKRPTSGTVSEESKVFNSVFIMLLFYERKQGNKNKYSYLLILQRQTLGR